MKRHWVMKAALRDGTRYQIIADYEPDKEKARKRLVAKLYEYIPLAEIRRRGGGLMKIFVGREKESKYSKAKKLSTTGRLDSDKNLHVQSETKRCRQS